MGVPRLQKRYPFPLFIPFLPFRVFRDSDNNLPFKLFLLCFVDSDNGCNQISTEPFTEWFNSIRDITVKKRIEARLFSFKSGNFGDHKPVGNGVWELRLDFGAGYRIYYGQVDRTVVLLLCGGDKSSQSRDTERAKNYWKEYKERYDDKNI